MFSYGSHPRGKPEAFFIEINTFHFQRKEVRRWLYSVSKRPEITRSCPTSYIVKIVRNISLKIYWRKEAAKRSGHYTIALEEIEGCIADQKTVEDEIEARELARIIEAFLDTLTVKERVIRSLPPLSRATLTR